jgi:hypothetical protein
MPRAWGFQGGVILVHMLPKWFVKLVEFSNHAINIGY